MLPSPSRLFRVPRLFRIEKPILNAKTYSEWRVATPLGCERCPHTLRPPILDTCYQKERHGVPAPWPASPDRWLWPAQRPATDSAWPPREGIVSRCGGCRRRQGRLFLLPLSGISHGSAPASLESAGSPHWCPTQGTALRFEQAPRESHRPCLSHWHCLRRRSTLPTARVAPYHRLGMSGHG
jgi:hypothetical protein